MKCPDCRSFFIGLPICETQTQQLQLWLSGKKEFFDDQADFVWENPRNWHVTLRYLGGIAKETAQQVADFMMKSVSQFPAFDYAIGHVGGFPKPYSKILAAHIQSSPTLDKLYRALSVFGEPGIKITSHREVFLPHITLAKLLEAIRIENFFGDNWLLWAKHVVLYEVYKEPRSYVPFYQVELS